MRIVWLSATVDTPSCDARSVRGVMMSSGRCKSAEIRGARNSGTVFICSTSVAAVWSSFLGSEPDNMTDTSRPEPPPPGPLAWNVTRASAILVSSGVRSSSNSWLVRARSSFKVMNMLALPSRTLCNAVWTSGCFSIIAAASLATSRVRSSVVPGTISMRTRLKSVLPSGKNCFGRITSSITVSTSDIAPIPIIQRRWPSDQRRIFIYLSIQPASACSGMPLDFRK